MQSRFKRVSEVCEKLQRRLNEDELWDALLLVFTSRVFPHCSGILGSPPLINVMFVVDSNDRERILEAREELQQLNENEP